MKKRTILLIAVAATVIVLGGCSAADYITAKNRVTDINDQVNIGDDIHQAERKLSEQGYDTNPVGFGSIEENSYVFSVQVTEYDSLDWLGYGMSTNLRPWRNAIPYHVVFRSNLDGEIHTIEVK